MTIENMLHRRDFAKAIAVGLSVVTLPPLRAQQPLAQSPQRPKTLKIGLSTLAWNVSTTSVENFESAVKDASELGYWSVETVSPIIEAYDKDGTLARLIERYNIPLKAGYIDVNVTDPSVRKENIEKVIRVGKIVKKLGGNYVVVSANGRRPPGAVRGPGPQGPDTFKFQEHKADMVTALNDYGMAAADLGLGSGLHQHTGTVIEKRDEVYAILESINTKVMAFAPDVGQLQKAGSDAAQVVKDFAKITTHMHLKDFSNGKYMGGYCPLGMGVVDIESILDTLEQAGLNPDVMHELDRGNAPISARDTAIFSKAYLTRLGYKFRS
jgi:inosose dehydratase